MFSDISQQNSSQKEKTPETAKEKIYIIPEKFISKEVKKRSYKIIFFAIGFSIVISLAAIIILFFNKKIKSFEGNVRPLGESQNINNTSESITNESQNQSIAEGEQIITEVFKNDQGVVKGSLKLTIPDGALPENTKIKITAYPREIYQDYDKKAQIIGPVYFIEPKVALLKTASLVLIYNEKDASITEEDAKSFKIGYLKDNIWRVLNTKIDEVDKTFLSAPVDELLDCEYAIIFFPQEKSSISSGELPSTPDYDRDGLTDEEEKIYKTDSLSSDTDTDTYSDGNEVIGLYSPISKEGNLSTSGLVNLYTNPIFNYNIFYPSGWIVQALDETNDTIIFTSITGEFITVLALENPSKLSALNWYKDVMAGINSSEMAKIKKITIAGQEAIEIPNSEGQTIAYFARGDKVYGLVYSYANKVELNFKTTFIMMKNSFKFN